MAAIDLSPIDARLGWATAHAERVRSLSAEWAAGALRESVSFDTARARRVYQAEVVGDPPLTIALALGDVLHQARATLDSLVGVLRGGATGTSAFRIDTDPEVFDADRKGRLAGVPAWAVAAMRHVQPFPDNPMQSWGDILARLNALAIDDRHHALLLSAAVIDMDQVYAGTSHPGQTEFRLRADGRLLTLESPADAEVTPHAAATVLVVEPRLHWPDGRFPQYPTAPEFADTVVRGVGVALDTVRWAGQREGAL